MASSPSAAPAAVPPAPDPNSPLARLAALAQRLGTPGAGKLHREARRRGIRVTQEEVRNFVRSRGQKQLFRRLPASGGRSAAESPKMRYQMDLIDMKHSPSLGNSVILVLINVFSRKGFAIAVKDKTPQAVASGLTQLLFEVGHTPVVIFTDKGGEWAGRVQTILEMANVVHRVKSDKDDLNALGVIDRFIQSLKTRLAESLAETPGEWAERLREVMAQYNATPHATLHDEPPNEAHTADNKVLRFMLHQDNARKLRHNQDLLESRTTALEETGTFRRPLAGLTKFRRGFQASYGPVERVESITGSLVKPTGDGLAIDIKRVQAVPADTTPAQPGFAMGEARAEARRSRVAVIAERLVEWLGDEEKSMQAAAAHLKRELGQQEYDRLLASVRANSLSVVVQLFPDMLQQTRQGVYLRQT